MESCDVSSEKYYFVLIIFACLCRLENKNIEILLHCSVSLSECFDFFYTQSTHRTKLNALNLRSISRTLSNNDLSIE